MKKSVIIFFLLIGFFKVHADLYKDRLIEGEVFAYDDKNAVVIIQGSAHKIPLELIKKENLKVNDFVKFVISLDQNKLIFKCRKKSGAYCL